MSSKLKEFGIIKSYNQIFEFLSTRGSEYDIKNSFISISGYGEFICFGYEKNLVIASLTYNMHSKNSDKVNFHVTFQDSICDKCLDEQISSILVIPIASQKQSSQGLPDWSCICVGFTSGVIKFFDQNGQLLFSQKLSNLRVDQIQLHSCPCYNAPDSISESLMIVSGNCCFQIDGSHLYESLNSFKKQLARIHAGFIDPDWEKLQMNYKQWILDSQEHIAGIVFGYETRDCVFDNLFLNASNKGPFATIPDKVTKYINCVTVGKNPFAMFYRLPLEADSLDMGDLAHAVYSKVKGVISTSLSSWLGSSQTAQKPNLAKKSEITTPESPARLVLRHSFEESSRRSLVVIGCPQLNTYSRLAAMTDDFGRIFLIDIDEGVIIRIWKGYRDAQISITTSSVDRHVNFLLIYAPRRSMIEIWTIPFGERVSSFDMRDRNGRLLHVPHRLLGLSRCLKNNQKLGQCYTTFFLDSTGKLSVIEIPFHLSLLNTSNERSQDHLVLKHFKELIKNEITKPDLDTIRSEFSLSLRMLKLVGSVDLLTNSIVSLSHLPMEFIISMFNEVLELTDSETLVPSSSDNERSRLKNSCRDMISLISCYKALSEMSNQEVPSHNEGDDDLEILLNLDTEDCVRIQKLYDLYCQYNKSTSCHFPENQTYHLFTNNLNSPVNTNGNSSSSFELAKHVSDKDVLNIGCVIFKKCIIGEYPIETILNLVISDTKIDQVSCFKICLTYLIHESVDVIMLNLFRIKKLISGLFNSGKCNTFVPTCLSIAYDICEKTSYLMVSLLISMTIRVIISEMMSNFSENDSHEFVTLLTDSLLIWNETCQRLEDLSIFNCLLKCQPSMYNLMKTKKSSVTVDRALTLCHVMEHGKGIFSESFAKWAFKWNLGFIDIHDLYKSLGYDSEIDNQESWTEESNLNSEIKEIFSILYKQLPHSLEYDSVLINVAWEYTRLWSQSIQRVEYLRNACELLENVGPAYGSVIQGIGGMIWDMHIKSSLETFLSADKSDVSKYSSTVIVSIVTSSIRFLKCILNSLENLDVMPTFSSEDMWNADNSRSSLIELAVAKDPVIGNGVELHVQLLYALQLVSIVDFHNFNCQLLYSSEARKYFFGSLTKSVPDTVIHCDLTQCQSHRMRFMERIISLCTMKFSDDSGDISICQKVNEIIKMLSEKWQLKPEDVRQSWIQNYYKAGLDSQAAMYLDKVENTSLMAANLLRIVGIRIKKEFLVPKSRNHREYFKYVTPQLNRWFQNLEDATIKETSLQQTNILMDQILEWLPEDSFDFEAATCLQSLILNIAKTKKYLE